MDQDDQGLACRFPALLDPFVDPHPWPQRPGDEEQSHKVASGRGRHDAQTDGDRKDEQEGEHTPGRRRSAAPRMDFGGQTRHTRDSKDCPACDPEHHAQPVISTMRWCSKLLAPRVTVSRRVALKTRTAALPLWAKSGSLPSATRSSFRHELETGSAGQQGHRRTCLHDRRCVAPLAITARNARSLIELSCCRPTPQPLRRTS
jgi:hypothetical protein